MPKPDIIFASAGSIMSIVFIILVNYLTSPTHIWFIYPVLFLLLWPISLHFIKKHEYRVHSVFTSLLVILFLMVINYLYCPSHPWFLYASYPIVWWPIMMIVENARKTVSFAILVSLITIAYYSVLNAALSPQYPWVIYPSFIVLWWPLAIYHVKSKKFFQFSICGSMLIITFLIGVNIVSSPNVIWAVYPIFMILWWPLTMYYYKFKREKLIYCNQIEVKD